MIIKCSECKETHELPHFLTHIQTHGVDYQRLCVELQSDILSLKEEYKMREKSLIERVEKLEREVRDCRKEINKLKSKEKLFHSKKCPQGHDLEHLKENPTYYYGMNFCDECSVRNIN